MPIVVTHKETRLQAYRRMQSLWWLLLACPEPDWHLLRQLHANLCRREAQLARLSDQERQANRQQRLQDAGRAGVRLSPVPAGERPAEIQEQAV